MNILVFSIIRNSYSRIA